MELPAPADRQQSIKAQPAGIRRQDREGYGEPRPTLGLATQRGFPQECSEEHSSVWDLRNDDWPPMYPNRKSLLLNISVNPLRLSAPSALLILDFFFFHANSPRQHNGFLIF